MCWCAINMYSNVTMYKIRLLFNENLYELFYIRMGNRSHLYTKKTISCCWCCCYCNSILSRHSFDIYDLIWMMGLIIIIVGKYFLVIHCVPYSWLLHVPWIYKIQCRILLTIRINIILSNFKGENFHNFAFNILSLIQSHFFTMWFFSI